MERHNYHSYLREGQEGESGELEATWSHFRNWKGDNANPPENHFYFQLGVVADTSYSCAATWMELGKLQNWARRNLMKFNKCFSLAPVQMGGVGGWGEGEGRCKWLQSGFAEKELWVLVNNNLYIKKQCALLEKKAKRVSKGIASRPKHIIYSLCYAMVRHIWRVMSSSGFCCETGWFYPTDDVYGKEMDLVEQVQQKR